jgi:outer membrane protein OmpA-like peptidoglycan-associated protein
MTRWGLALMLLCGSALADESVPGPRVKVGADRLELAAPIYFDAGKASIKAQSLPLLDEVAQALDKTPRIQLLEVGVHSDERGAEEFNLRITGERAQAIKTYLVSKGVAADRLQARGYGESKPLCAEHNEACWSRNRRTELLVVRAK